MEYNYNSTLPKGLRGLQKRETYLPTYIMLVTFPGVRLAS